MDLVLAAVQSLVSWIPRWLQRLSEKHGLRTVAVGWRLKVTLPWTAVLHDNHRFIAIRMGKKARLAQSPEYREKKAVAETVLCAAWHGRPKMIGNLRLHALCYFPDRRKRDSGNYRKLCTDALSGIAYTDDSQLISETWERAAIDRENPRIEITLEEAA